MSNLEKLENAYFEGLVKGYWNIEKRDKSVWFKNPTDKYAEDVIELEVAVRGVQIGSSQMASEPAWQKAYSRFKEMEQSPLMQGLK